MAVRAGGEGDVTKTNILWSGKERSRIGTPVVDNGRIYWFGSRIANCIDAATGKQVYRTRVDGGAVPEMPGPGMGPGPRASGGGPPPGPPPGQPGQRPRGGFGGRGGGMRGISDRTIRRPSWSTGTIYFVSRSGEVFVYATGPEFKLLGTEPLCLG